MMLNPACLSFAQSESFIEPGARTQGPPVIACRALLSYSQGLTGVGWSLNLIGLVLHRTLVDIQQLLSVKRTVTELWSSFWLHIRFTGQLRSVSERIIASDFPGAAVLVYVHVYHLCFLGKVTQVFEHYIKQLRRYPLNILT